MQVDQVAILKGAPDQMPPVVGTLHIKKIAAVPRDRGDAFLT
jgi:hypothetical protein